MRDDDLREGLDTLLRPIREDPPPELPAIRRRMRRHRARTAAGGVTAIAVAAVTGVAVYAGVAAHPAASPTSQNAAAYTVPAADTLVVTGDVGGVSIQGSTRTTISVTEQRFYADAAPVTTRTVVGKTLTLSYICRPAEQYCGVRYQIEVPRDTAVRVVFQTGAIQLSGLSGPVTATTGTGGIETSGLTSADVTLRTGTGAISAGFAAPPDRLQATVRTGAINIGVPGTVDYDVTATSTTESVVDVPESPAAAHVIDAATQVGPITVVPGAPARSPQDARNGSSWTVVPFPTPSFPLQLPSDPNVEG